MYQQRARKKNKRQPTRQIRTERTQIEHENKPKGPNSPNENPLAPKPSSLTNSLRNSYPTWMLPYSHMGWTNGKIWKIHKLAEINV